jgi:hypothetical protein
MAGLLLRASASSSLLAVALSLCVVTQNCTGGSDCRPTAVSPPSQPFPLPPPGGYGASCPQYASSGCCTAQQNVLLKVSFLSLTAAFGECLNGGCPSCQANLEAFWCAMLCGPDQDQFLTPLGDGVKPDPTRGGENATVLQMRVRVNRTVARQVFSSCSRTRVVNETAFLNATFRNFFAYADFESIQHGAFFNFTYAGPKSKKPSLSFEPSTCSASASVDDPIPCPLSTCNASCPYPAPPFSADEDDNDEEDDANDGE